MSAAPGLRFVCAAAQVCKLRDTARAFVQVCRIWLRVHDSKAG